MLFEKKDFGKTISQKLSAYIKTHTGKVDHAEVASELGVSPSTIRDVIYRTNVLTERSAPAIIEMMRRAIKNCDQSINDSREAKEFLAWELEDGLHP